MQSTRSLTRFHILYFSFFLFLFIFIGRLFWINCFHSQYLSHLAAQQHNLCIELPPQRGVIYDRYLRPLTVDIRAYSVFATPNKIDNPQKTAVLLSDILGIDEEFLRGRLESKKHFAWIKRRVSDEQMQEIKDLKLEGIFFIKENKRSYPNGPLAAQILGFTNIDGEGLEGIEALYNSYLKGAPGIAYFVRDARQKPLRLVDADKLPRDGNDVVLTIDQVIQYISENAVDKAFRQFHPKGACVIVLNPSTGEILALVNRPTFNPNYPQQASSDDRRNRAICDFFEPGSVFKIITASAALENNIVKESDRIFCENGTYKVANHILHDHTPHGWLTFAEVVQQSSNIGFTKVAQRMGLEKVVQYAKAYGIGTLTGVGLPGEVKGMLKNISSYSKTSIGAVPIGQEVCVTAMQLACAISVVANGGTYYKPHIIKRIQDKFDEPIKEFKPQCVRTVIRPETSQRLRVLLSQVVEKGTGKLAKSDEFVFAGKTGTAQKIESNGTYSHSKFYASFIGFAPAVNPRLAIVVVFDEPFPYYGGVVSAPVFKEIAEKSLKYLEVQEKIDSLTHVAKQDTTANEIVSARR